MARLATVVLCLVLVGCAYMKALVGLGPTRPKVRVTEIAVTKASLRKLDLMVSIRVDNPNEFDLVFSKLRYKMEATGLVIADGLYDEDLRVPEKGSAVIRLPLSIDASAAFLLLKKLMTETEEVYAELTAVANFETPLGQMTVDFDDKRPLRKLAGF